MTPAERGFAMPPEWASHRATWLAWPHEKTDWPDKLATIFWVYAEIVLHLVRGERVGMLVRTPRERDVARKVLRRAGADTTRVDFRIVPTDRSWTRDSGPIFVRDRDTRLVAVDFGFNAWAKYPNWKRDTKVARRIAEFRRVESWRAGMICEGGAIDVDGEGTLLATEECLLSKKQARNPGLGRAATEKALGDALGITKVVWLGKGIAGDDTHGHVDDLCRFVAPGRVLLVQERNRKDANWAALAENRERLESARDAAGRRIEVVPLPMPSPLFFDGVRLPASYANFYVANGRVLVPTFDDPMDRCALGILAEQFPEREVVGIHAVDLVWGFGTIHCMTQQEPEGR